MTEEINEKRKKYLKIKELLNTEVGLELLDLLVSYCRIFERHSDFSHGDLAFRSGQEDVLKYLLYISEYNLPRLKYLIDYREEQKRKAQEAYIKKSPYEKMLSDSEGIGG